MFRANEHYIILQKRGTEIWFSDVDSESRHHFSCQQVYTGNGPWISDSVIHSNDTVYTLKQSRTCTQGDLGRPRNCVGAKERTFTYFWIRANMTFFDAREHCHKNSAKLFDYFDGEVATIEFLLRHMLPVQTFWIGLNRPESWSTGWITEEDQDMSKYVKISGKSSKAPTNKCLTMSHDYSVNERTPIFAFFRRAESEMLPSVCYLIEELARF